MNNKKTLPILLIIAGIALVALSVFLLTKKRPTTPKDEPAPKKDRFGDAMQQEETDVKTEDNE